MENIPTNEANGKWRTRLKTWTKRAIILSVIFGLGWLFGPLLGVKLDIYWDKMNHGINTTYSDYYRVKIGGITYAKDKFYILLRKPYLFNVSYGYIYSSINLSNWLEEGVSLNIPTGGAYPYDIDNYYTDYNGYSIWKSDNSNISNDSLPREISDNCYIVVFQSGFVSHNCNGDWQPYKFLTDTEKKLVSSNNSESITADNARLTDGKICKLYQQGILKEKLLESIYCAPKLSLANINAYHVLYKIVQANKLDILLDGSHTTYGGGKYVGVFYKNKQYYFIISTDGIHYEIKPAPSELVSSLAINLFK